MVATANWFLIKWSIELGRDAFVLIQKSSFLPAWWLCLFQCQHNVGREELSLLCSTPHRDKGLEVQNALWWSGSHLLDRGGKSDNNRRLPKWKGWDHRQLFFQQQKLFTPQEAGKEPADVIKPVIRMKSRPKYSQCAEMTQQARRAGAEPVALWASLNTSSPGICQEPGCDLSVAVDADRQISQSFTHAFHTVEGAPSMCQTAC